jgi:predicted AAA+ superfamily ATPase
MIARSLQIPLLDGLDEAPAVCLLGPRQCGKTTLALEVGKRKSTLYLDLESEQDRAKIAEGERYLERYMDRLVILDEIHRVPELFPILRGLIDRARRSGPGNGRYLLLGSASGGLLRLSGESLAGRIRYLELTPFEVLEATAAPLDTLWLRGGFPLSLLAPDDARSLRWRQDFIRTCLERDIPQFGPRIPTETLRRFWTMLAHCQGAQLNTAVLARNLGIDVKTVSRYTDLLVDLMLLRKLPPWHANVGKRLVKSPRLYLRDSGVLHALLAVRTVDDLLAHPVVGASWEGFVIENLLAVARGRVQAFFYRTGGGAEIDLLLDLPGGELWAVEIKRSIAPRAERGFHAACSDLEPARRYIVYPGTERYPSSAGIEIMPLQDLARDLLARLDAGA